MSDVHEYAASEGWSGQVRFSGGHDGFAYRSAEVVTGGEQGVEAANRLFPGFVPEALPEPVFPEPAAESPGLQRPPQLFLLRLPDGAAESAEVVDPLEIVEVLRAEGVVAQPNHVVFTHGAGCCPPHPSSRWGAHLSGSPVYASPVYASPVYASPVYASPVYASPVYASPVYASELQARGQRRSSARPAAGPSVTLTASAAPAHPVRVAVLDTGMAGDEFRPSGLDAIAAAVDRQHWEKPDHDGDDHLDPAAGHGTFIAGLIDLLAPGCEFTVERVLSSYGEGDEVAIARRIHALAGNVDILNLSFGGYAMEHMHVLAVAVRRAQAAGTVVVASAGNDATCRPTFPAALPGVVGVGAIGPNGPAPFSNYGPWVRACAPGVDLVSWFFKDFDGPDRNPAGGVDPDHFVTWARWSGTSFAAPVVVAALARQMLTYGVGAQEAVRRVVDDPCLLKIPDLGTVVNLA